MRHRIIFRRWYRGSHTPSTEHPPKEICYRHTPYAIRHTMQDKIDIQLRVVISPFANTDFNTENHTGRGTTIQFWVQPTNESITTIQKNKNCKKNVRAGRGCFSLLIHVVNLMTKNSRPTTSVHILDHERTRNIHLVQTSSNTDHPTAQNPWSG